jgi:MraZ protein
MVQLLGEFDCKLDAKGRLMVPSSLKKQLPNLDQEGLVINRGFEKHLVIYPKNVWAEKVAELGKLNQYEEKSRQFIRLFTRGASELMLDAAGRVNCRSLCWNLLEYPAMPISFWLAKLIK